MKTQTPMKRLRNHFDIFNQLIGNSFNTFVLNASERKEIPYPFQPHNWRTKEDKTYMKGVESDFIRVYQNRDADNSFAFIFDYIDKEPEDFRIRVSIKTGANQYFSSELFTVEDFRLLMNSFAQKNKNIKQETGVIFNAISEHFMQTEYDEKAHIASAENELNEALYETQSDFDSKKIEFDDLSNTLSERNKKLKNYISRTKEQKEINKLEAQLRELKKDLKIKSDNKRKELEIDKLTNQINSLRKSLNFIKEKAREIALNFKKSLPKSVSKRMNNFTID